MEVIHPPRRFYIPAVKKMRLLLLICAILFTYGLHPSLGDFSSMSFGFAFPALYIISGFLVLRESANTERRILRTIRRTAICFLVLLMSYLTLSLLLRPETTLYVITSKRFWRDFILLNIWSLPVGTTIWFVQAMLYAYIIIYILYKLKLLKLDIFLAGLFFVFTLATGELAGFTGFHLLGHTYLGGNFLTRALPYILIGRFINRKANFFSRLDFIHYAGIAAGGLVLSVGEYILLYLTGKNVYTGHLLGMGFLAAAISMFAFFMVGMELRMEPLRVLTRFELSIPFFVCSPVYAILATVLGLSDSLVSTAGRFIGPLTVLGSFLVLYAYFYLRLLFAMIRLRKRKNEPTESET